MITVPIIRRPRAETSCVSMPQLIYAGFGLHTGFAKKPRLQRATCAVWLMIHVSGFLMVLFTSPVLRPGVNGVSVFSMFFGNCIFIASIVLFAVQIIRKHDEIELFIRDDGSRPGRWLLQLAYTTPWALLGVRKGFFAQDTMGVVNEFYYALVHYSLMVFFLASSDAVINVKKAHANLLDLTADIDANLELIRRLKWELRDRVQSINDIFSWTWGMHCGLLFNSTIFVVVEVMDEDLSFPDKIVLLMANFSSLLRLYRLAAESSSLKELCLKAESKVLNATQASGSDRAEGIPGTFLSTIAFREDWDILRNGCFPLELTSFLSLLIYNVTCTAVVLQFDYRVLQSLELMSANSQD